jgi:hypothetical protein
MAKISPKNHTIRNLTLVFELFLMVSYKRGIPHKDNKRFPKNPIHQNMWVASISILRLSHKKGQKTSLLKGLTLILRVSDNLSRPGKTSCSYRVARYVYDFEPFRLQTNRTRPFL